MFGCSLGGRSISWRGRLATTRTVVVLLLDFSEAQQEEKATQVGSLERTDLKSLLTSQGVSGRRAWGLWEGE